MERDGEREGQAVVEKIMLEGGGTLSLREDGPRVHTEARRQNDGQGLYKVWLRGGGKGRLLLGTWQGIWLGEHRIHGGSRKIIATLQGE